MINKKLKGFLLKPLVKGKLNFLLIYLCSLVSLVSLSLFTGSYSFANTTLSSSSLLSFFPSENQGKVLQASSGKTYYVAQNNLGGCNDDWTGLSEAEPWCTVQKAADTADDGDTVYIREGTYNEKVTVQNSGSADNYITFASYPGETATIDAAGLEVDTYEGIFFIWEKSYIKISGLRIVNSTGAGIKASYSSDLVIEDNYTRDTYSSGIGVWWSSNIVVDGNEVVNARNVPYPDGHEECITLSAVDNFEVKNNEVYYEGIVGYLGGAGIDAKEECRNGKIYNNYVHDVEKDTGIYLDAWKAGLEGRPTLNNIEVYQNRVDNCLAGVSLGGEVGGTAENIKIYNNLLTKLGFAGILFNNTAYDGTKGGLRKDVSIYNNTIYESWSNGGAGIYFHTDNVENIVIRNNISDFDPRWVGQITVCSESTLTEITADHNLTFGRQECANDCPNCREVPSSIIGDPKFVNPSTGDFHLQSDSPAIDAGTTISFINSDFEGNLRPQGGAYDIGAYEYGGEPAPSPTPTPPPSPSPSPSPAPSVYDLNSDDVVDESDISVLLPDWGSIQSVADFNSDGMVNALDFALLVENFTSIQPSPSPSPVPSPSPPPPPQPSPSPSPSPASPALLFDGVDDYVNMGDQDGLDMGTKDFTIEAWVKTAVSSGIHTIVYKGAGAPTEAGYWFWYYTNDDDLRLYLSDGVTRLYGDSNNSLGLNDDSWHHIAAVADRDGNVEFFMDGNSVGMENISSFSSNSLDTTTGFNIMGLGGKIDEVRVWDDVRTQAELQQNMSKQIDSSSANLVGYWRLNENSGQNVYDETSNNHDGTLGWDTSLENVDPAWTTGFVPE